MHNLEKFKVEKCPCTVYYIPDFITKDEENYLLHKVESAPKPKWVCLKNRRLQNWGGVPQPKGMVPEPIPDWLNSYCSKLAALDLFDSFKPNHILVNEYKTGQGKSINLVINNTNFFYYFFYVRKFSLKI